MAALAVTAASFVTCDRRHATPEGDLREVDVALRNGATYVLPSACCTTPPNQCRQSGPKAQRLSQLDYLFVSHALYERMEGHGIERRGMHALKETSGGAEAPFETVDGWQTAASDHAGIWAEFDVNKKD